MNKYVHTDAWECGVLGISFWNENIQLLSKQRNPHLFFTVFTGYPQISVGKYLQITVFNESDEIASYSFIEDLTSFL